MRTPKPSSDLCWMVGEQRLLLRLWQGSDWPLGVASDLCWMVGEPGGSSCLIRYLPRPWPPVASSDLCHMLAVVGIHD